MKSNLHPYDPCRVARNSFHAVLGDSKICRWCGKSLGKLALREARVRRANGAKNPPLTTLQSLQSLQSHVEQFAEHRPRRIAYIQPRTGMSENPRLVGSCPGCGAENSMVASSTDKHTCSACGDSIAFGVDWAKEADRSVAVPVRVEEAQPVLPLPRAPPPFRRSMHPASRFALFAALALGMGMPEPPPRKPSDDE